jgi:glycerol uptake facilitator-like aquaporin
MGVKYQKCDIWDFRKKGHFLHECFCTFLVVFVIFEVSKSRAQKCHFSANGGRPAFPEVENCHFSMPFQGT